jgi:uncharacterized RDD family membrane protein YckC
MQQVGIETAQNVVLDHEVASIGDRIVAYLIDALIIWGWVMFMFFMFAISASSVLRGAGTGFIILFLVVTFFPYAFYHLICELTMDGQSLGKRARSIKVARIDGGQPTLGQYLLRWILRFVDEFYWIGMVVILINGRGQRLGDLAAGTTVVSLKPRVRLKDTVMAEVAATHQVRFPGAVRMTDRQAAMIREVLNSTSVANRWTVMEELATKVRRVVGDEGAGMKAQQFLEVVLKDFVYITGGQEPTTRSRTSAAPR